MTDQSSSALADHDSSFTMTDQSMMDQSSSALADHDSSLTMMDQSSLAFADHDSTKGVPWWTTTRCSCGWSSKRTIVNPG
jgi:hypothetical protein